MRTILKPIIQTKALVRSVWAFLPAMFPFSRGADSEVSPFLHHCINRQILKTSIKTALVVGTLLAIINHFDGIVRASLTQREIFQILITFVVPFSVATYSGARHAQYVEGLHRFPKVSSDKPE